MANSRKPLRSSTLLARVRAVLKQHVKRGDHLVAGFSGGVDSMVLLDLLQRASMQMRFDLSAIHVNHQINPASRRWAAFCRSQCNKRGIQCKVVRVTVPRGNSLEAAARDARYRAFARLRAGFVVLAHNQDDQAETVLLQLLRGAGVKGLSAMPELRAAQAQPPSASIHPSILRPLLGVARSEIEIYARRRKLEWIEDDSNSDLKFDRNFVRHQVLPVIAQRYPAYRKILTRSSHHFAEAAHLLDELAALDVPVTSNGLSIAVLRRFSASRAKNAIRYFLAGLGVAMPNAARLDEYVRQLLDGTRSQRTALDLGCHELRRFSGELQLVTRTDPPPARYACVWRGESSVLLSELGGTLRMKKKKGAGISLKRLMAAPVMIRVREGGERFMPDARRPRRSLKNLYQEARVPPWLRDRLPLLFSGSTLVYVPGIGTDPAYRAVRGEPGVEPSWEGP